MRIFKAFLVIVAAVFLFLLPVTPAIYDFRTDLREDTFESTTLAETSANVSLFKAIYDDDTETITILSSKSDDVPLFSTYNSTTRKLGISGLSSNLTRTLSVSYDISSLEGNDAINTVLNIIPYFWLICCAVFAPAAVFALFTGRV